MGAEGVWKERRECIICLGFSKSYPHTGHRNTQGRHPRSVGETQKQSSPHVPAHLLFCLHKHVFSSFLFSAALNTRGRRVGDRRRTLEEGGREVRGEHPVTTNAINQTLNLLGLAPPLQCARSVSSQGEHQRWWSRRGCGLDGLDDGILSVSEALEAHSLLSPSAPRGLCRLHRTGGGHRHSLPCSLGLRVASSACDQLGQQAPDCVERGVAGTSASLNLYRRRVGSGRVLGTALPCGETCGRHL